MSHFLSSKCFFFNLQENSRDLLKYRNPDDHVQSLQQWAVSNGPH